MTLRERISNALSYNNETWENVIAHNLSESDLNQKIDFMGFGPFNLWTEKYVYFQIHDADEGCYISSEPRNPPIKNK